MADTMDKLFKKKRMICTMCRSKIGQAAIKLAATAWVMISVYMWLAPLAYLERGYVAYGGECLAAVLAGVSVFYFGRR